MRQRQASSDGGKRGRGKHSVNAKEHAGYAAFTNHIRMWLERHNISQADLAHRAGIAQATLSSWLLLETAPTNIVTLSKIADATGEDIHRYISLITEKPYNGALVEKTVDAAELDQLRQRLEELAARVG